jgi:hypothetical protein
VPARPSDASHAIAFGKIPAMEHVVRVFSSFDEAEQADAAFYANLTPQERLDVLLELIERHRSALGPSTQRFERVVRVVDLAHS